ncbi:MAG TPA: hypothetical protein PLT65_04305 [Bacilli bacterium]|nr:hypothetical protein [Bacilli bacterium]
MLYGWEVVLLFVALVVGFGMGRFYEREEQECKRKCVEYGSYTKMANKESINGLRNKK